MYGDIHTNNYPKYDGLATEYAITAKIREILLIADEYTTVAIIFSGHGGSRGGTIVFFCAWDFGAGEYGYDGAFYDYELAVIIGNSNAGQIFLFFDCCYSGGFIDNLVGLPNNKSIYCTTTSTAYGLGWESSIYKNGVWTYWFLVWGLVGQEFITMEECFIAANAQYNPASIFDEPMEFDGNPNEYFYL